MNPQQTSQPPRLKRLLPGGSNWKNWLLIIVSVAVGALLGYFYSDRNASREIQAVKQGSVFAKERVYVTDRLDFSLILPADWVKKVGITVHGASANFYFKNDQTGEKAGAELVFTIYRCSTADYEALKGNTDDVNKCPGRFLDRDDTTAYTWKENSKRYNLASPLKNSETVLEVFNRQVAPTFRIVK